MRTVQRSRARLGVFVPFTNTNLEPDLMMMCPADVSVHVTRLGGYDANEVPDSRQMAGLGAMNMDEPIRLLAGVEPDIVIYGCTSATMAHGRDFDAALSAQIASEGNARTITAAGALVHALQALEAERIAFASPYVPVLNDQAIAFLQSCGIETVSRADVAGTLDNAGQGNMSPEEVFDLGLQADSKKAKAIVLSCTDMRAVEVIEALETETGKPVVTSNQAIMFQALSQLNLTPARSGFGQLFDMQNAALRTRSE
ncbi:maleate cis-trans isomerase family protein [Roseobacter sp. EG26]|uniref:maleate cis-trans isomerase family protein n=1 Tax=Roseobacter sp. EG26 TaxID=3412477 RepID=UPI003CE580C7